MNTGSASTGAGERPGRTRHRYVRPDVDIYSTAEAVVLMVDMPGVTKEDLEVGIEGNELVIDGRVTERIEGESRLPWGYYRRFRLSSAIDREGVHAKLNDGVLRIELAKAGTGPVRKVDVE